MSESGAPLCARTFSCELAIISVPPFQFKYFLFNAGPFDSAEHDSQLFFTLLMQWNISGATANIRYTF